MGWPSQGLSATGWPSTQELEVRGSAFQGLAHGRDTGSFGNRHGGQGAVQHTCVDTVAGKSRAQILRGQQVVPRTRDTLRPSAQPQPQAIRDTRRTPLLAHSALSRQTALDRRCGQPSMLQCRSRTRRPTRLPKQETSFGQVREPVLQLDQATQLTGDVANGQVRSSSQTRIIADLRGLYVA